MGYRLVMSPMTSRDQTTSLQRANLITYWLVLLLLTESGGVEGLIGCDLCLKDVDVALAGVKVATHLT